MESRKLESTNDYVIYSDGPSRFILFNEYLNNPVPLEHYLYTPAAKDESNTPPYLDLDVDLSGPLPKAPEVTTACHWFQFRVDRTMVEIARITGGEPFAAGLRQRVESIQAAMDIRTLVKIWESKVEVLQ